ncbi:putative ibr domain-containing protein [Golovinomyces cichoracearum]|uniref:Putative ibr domain-containing protein n=1 Tax=Golovinomyces cichoracearum TaxID=62708 RepID=A0A420J6W0_9PEZI|nr:putative ibr domain-containing protein [Golovinomyces cichoracearum]
MVERQSLTNTSPNVPAEFDDVAYSREVLLLETGHADGLSEQNLLKNDQNLGVVSIAISSTVDSDKNSVSVHVRTVSSTSKNSSSTGLTSHSSNDHLSSEDLEEACTVRRKKEVMARMDALPSRQEDLVETKNLDIPLVTSCQSNPTSKTLQHKRSYQQIKDRIRIKVFMPRQKNPRQKTVISCMRCRESFQEPVYIHSLPCQHNFCTKCLQSLIMKTATSNDGIEAPPQCCSQMIPGSLIAAVLKADEQNKYLHSVISYQDRLKSHLLCPNLDCSRLISEYYATDPQCPLEAVCERCSYRVCSSCMGTSHFLGENCPLVWAHNTVLYLRRKKLAKDNNKPMETTHKPIDDERSSFENENNHSQAVEIPYHSETHNVDPSVFENKRLRENSSESKIFINPDHNQEANMGFTEDIVEEKIKNLERVDTQCVEISILRAQQVNERDRFRAFERKMKWYMATRHGKERIKAQKIFEKRIAKLKECHEKAFIRLEDIQVEAEYEMISKFQHLERNVRNRLRHMESYCDAVGRDPDDPSNVRVVTEKDLRQLGQQYNLRDSMRHVHQSKIKVLRDKQAKQLERLLSQQERELEVLLNKREELTQAEQRFKKEKDGLAELFAKRKAALIQKWRLEEQAEIQRLKEEKKFESTSISPPIEWPDQDLDS